jgi:ribosome-associated protein
VPSEKGSQRPAAPAQVPVRPPITLNQFLKVAQLASSGGEAKVLIADGAVKVNGTVEIRRGRKMAGGEVVEVGSAAARVEMIPGPDSPSGQQSSRGPDRS